MSQPYVSGQIKRGMSGVVGGGKQRAKVEIDSTKAIPWLLKNARAEGSAARKADPDLNPRDRLAKEQADRVALENEERRGNLCRMDAIEQLALRAAAGLANELDGLPGRLAGELATATDPATIRARLLEECRRIRTAYADQLGGMGAGGDDRRKDGRRDAATEETDTERMG